MLGILGTRCTNPGKASSGEQGREGYLCIFLGCFLISGANLKASLPPLKGLLSDLSHLLLCQCGKEALHGGHIVYLVYQVA